MDCCHVFRIKLKASIEMSADIFSSVWRLFQEKEVV